MSALPRVFVDLRSSLAWNWSRLAEPAALSLPVTLLYLPFGMVGPVFIDRGRLGGDWTSWMVVAVAGQAAIMGAFWAAALLRRRARHLPWQPGFTLGIIMAAVLIRALVIDEVAWLLGLVPVLETGYRLSAAIVTQTSVLIVLALVVSTYDRHRRVTADLESEGRRLAELNATMSDRLAEVRRELTMQVHQTIDPLIARLDAALDCIQTGTGTGEARDSIREIVDDQLRPLSHRLARETDTVVDLPDGVPETRAARAALPARVPLHLMISPLPLAGLVALLAASPALRELSPPEIFVFPLLSGALVGTLLAFARLIIGGLVVPLWAGVTSAAVLAGLALWAAYRIEVALEVTIPSSTVQAALITVTLLGAITAVYAAVNERRSATEEQLQAVIDERRARLSLLRQHAFVARRELSYIIHGSVQSALHAAAMRLGSSPTPDAALVASIRRDIAEATSRLDAPASPDVLLIDTLADIAELWDGTCTVRWTLDHRTVRLLVNSPSAAASVAEIARECVGNAIRHGRATDVWVTIARSEDRVVVSILDNGSGFSASAKRGLGSTMLDQMCVGWRHEPQSTGTRVVAEIATQAR